MIVCITTRMLSGTNTFIATGNLNNYRSYHVAALLQDGKVLVVGGQGYDWNVGKVINLKTCELYDPVAASWSLTTSTAIPRVPQGAVTLSDGKVLVYSTPSLAPCAEIITNQVDSDFSGTDSWVKGTNWTISSGKLTHASGNTATAYLPATSMDENFTPGQTYTVNFTLVTNGTSISVSCAGTSLGSFTSGGAKTVTFTATNTSPLTVTPLSGFVGSLDFVQILKNVPAASELYDPATPSWTATTGSMSTNRYQVSATVLQDGKVLFAGGSTNNSYSGALNTAEVYNPSTKTYSATTGAMVKSRFGHSAVLLNDGKVLITGGVDSTGAWLTSAELYNPVTGTFAATTGGMAYQREWHSSVLLSDGTVLVGGGYYNGSQVQTSEVYNPTSKTFSTVSTTHPTYMSVNAACTMANGIVLFVSNGDIYSADLYDSAPQTFSSPAGNQIFYASAGFTVTSLQSGQVLIAGGFNGGNLRSSQLFDPIM